MKKHKIPSVLPVLPLRDTVLLPKAMTPLLVGRKTSVLALNACTKPEDSKPYIFLVSQKNTEVENPGIKDLYEVGVVAEILQILQSEKGLYRILVQAHSRVKAHTITDKDGYYEAHVEPIKPLSSNANMEIALSRNLLEKFALYAKGQKHEIYQMAYNTACDFEDSPNQIADIIIWCLVRDIKLKQELLEERSITKRLEKVLSILSKEAAIMKMERQLRTRIQKQMEHSQREYYLNEHMKAIQNELSEMDGGELSENEQLEGKLRDAKMPEKILKKALGELKKLKMMAPVSAEASVVRGYLDWLISVPWYKRDELSSHLKYAREMLDKDHHGLNPIKERVMEYLAVQKRVKKNRGSIICLVGAPGVGKTSLGQSIARGTNRKYVRLSLGGMRDEAEIRGHRRTYIGAMPGKIIQKMAEAGTVNPLFLLDEVDKIGSDYRGDPAAALLEVLDPEQNQSFNDHYLEADYNLSEVLFICTANTLNIPPALLDRMEIIHIPGYTEDEKQIIAENYLLPRQMEYSGLKKSELKINSSAIRDLICCYTREAGVRSLEKYIAKICRKVVLRQIMQDESNSSPDQDKNPSHHQSSKRRFTVGATNLDKYCGIKKYDTTDLDSCSRVGQVYGLAWTYAGGEMLTIEATTVPGKARKTVTGSLGSVMKESVNAAITVVRARTASLGIDESFFENTDVHVHVPEGATPKDGPSAGVTMCVALISALTKIPVKVNVAMTGEITLQGRVLAIGGLKEKLLAAHRMRISKVIIPARNIKDLQDVPDNIKSTLDIVPVSWIDEILPHCLERMIEVPVSKKAGVSSDKNQGPKSIPRPYPAPQKPGKRSIRNPALRTPN